MVVFPRPFDCCLTILKQVKCMCIKCKRKRKLFGLISVRMQVLGHKLKQAMALPRPYNWFFPRTAPAAPAPAAP